MDIQIKLLGETDYSLADVHDLLWRANESNRNSGFVLKTSEMSEERLKDKIGDGNCYAAIADQKLVGTITARAKQGRSWYCSGKYVSYMLAAVLPEYQGKHINTALAQKVFEYAEKIDANAVLLDTASGNGHALGIYRHQGFKLVDFQSRGDTDHYHVTMVKWLKKPPCSEVYRIFRYHLKKAYVTLRYKPGKKKRFGI